MKFLKLVRLFVLRNMKEEKVLTFLSITGIALGIGLFIGVKVASDKAIASFESDLQGINRQVNYEIIDIAGIDFREEIYRNVRLIEENTFPVLRVQGYLPDIKDTCSIEGIYTVKAAGFLTTSPKRNFDIENFYRKLNGIFITKHFANAYSLKKGDSLTALVYDKKYLLEIVDILDGGLLPPNTVMMDLGNFQEYFGRGGFLSGIELLTDERKAEEIQKILPSNLSVEKKEQIIKNRKSLLKSFRYNLQFISLVAILVGVFLLYNTVFISVVKRRMQIGILRGLGADQKTVIMLFMLQGIILGSIGSVFGILLGQIAAYFSVLAVTKTISSMYSAISVPGYFVSARDVLLALILGLAVSLLASAIPAFESSKIRPYESLREGSFESKYKKYRTLFFLFGLFLFVSGCIFSWIDYRHAAFDFPFLAYFGVLFIIVGFTFISPSYLSIILKVVKTTFERMFGAMGKIAIGDVVGSLYRFSVALMSIAISSALIIALFTLIYSFRNSLKEWIQKNISADVYIKPASCISNFCFYPLSDEVVKAVGNMPEVAGIGRFRALYLDFRGKKVIAGFGERQEKIPRTGHDEPMREDSEERDQIGISRYLGMKYGLKQGDSIEVHTPRGDAKFVIRDIFSSYSTTSGYIYFDRNLLKKYWGLDDVTEIGISVKAGVDINHFIRKLKKRLSTRYSLEIRNNEELREKVLAIFNKSFAITYAIELISIMVSLIGVVNILLALVLERKRELSIIRYLGGSWKQIQQLILLSAGIVGICGISFGSLMGFIMSVIFVTVINELSFGWEIHFEIPLLYLSLMAMVLFSTTLFACLIPSRVARKIDPKKFISFE